MLHYLFSYQGRISRRGMWFFYLINLVYMVLLLGLIGVVSYLLGGPNPLDAIVYAMIGNPTAAWQWAVLGLYWGGLIAFLYPFGAVATKRLHDRNKGGRWLYLVLGIPAGLIILGIITLTGHAVPQTWLPVILGIGLVGDVLLLWLTIELFFLPGTRGDNRFGPDPRAKMAAN